MKPFTLRTPTRCATHYVLGLQLHLLASCAAAPNTTRSNAVTHPQPLSGKPAVNSLPSEKAKAGVLPIAPSSSSTVGPPEASRSAAIASQTPAYFDCLLPRRQAKVEGRFTQKFSVQFQGNPLEGESEMVVHYGMSVLDAPGDTHRFEVVLIDHNGAQLVFQSDLWREAFQKGWVGIDVPVVIAGQGHRWCIEGRKRCPAKDPNERALARTLGEMARSVLGVSWVGQQLQGRASDGTLELELPDTLANRLGYPVKPHPKLKQLGAGMPAQFTLDRTVSSHMPDVNIMYGGSLDRFRGTGPQALRLTVERDCSIGAIESFVDLVMPSVPNHIRNFNASWSSRWRFTGPPP